MIVKTEDDSVLEHFGVKGMHWGHRKGAPSAPQKTAREEAKARQEKHDRMVRLAATGAAAVIIFGPGIMRASNIIAGHAVNAKRASNGRKAAAAMFSDRNGLASFKLIDLGLDATGAWS